MGSAGINLSAALSALGRIQAAFSAPINIGQERADQDAEDLVTGPWSPPQYAQAAITMITVPASQEIQVSGGGAGVAPIYRSSAAINYVFDATLRVVHSRRLRKTQHPVLTAANISDHAFVEPARVTIDIGMSDAMAAFSSGMWTQSATKSISAFQVLKQLQVDRILVTLTTRLDTYVNMLVTDVSAPDDVRTRHGLRASVTLEEIIAGSVASISSSSARSQTTGSTSLGTVQGAQVDPAVAAQHVIPSAQFPNTPTYPQVPGAGNVSSNSLSQVGVGVTTK